MNNTDQTENFEVFLGGISAHSTEAFILAILEAEVGPTTLIELPVSSETGLSKGFAKIRFKNCEDAKEAIQRRHITMDGLKVAVKPWVNTSSYILSKEEVSQRKIYVRFPKSITESMIDKYFSKFGRIELIDMKRDIISREERCFCYITFENKEGALAAAAGLTHKINQKKVRCKMAVPPVRKRARPETSHFSTGLNQFVEEAISEIEHLEPVTPTEGMKVNKSPHDLLPRFGDIDCPPSSTSIREPLISGHQYNPYLTTIMLKSGYHSHATLQSLTAWDELQPLAFTNFVSSQSSKKRLRLPQEGNTPNFVLKEQVEVLEVTTHKNLKAWLALQHNRDIDHRHSRGSNLVFRLALPTGALPL